MFFRIAKFILGAILSLMFIFPASVAAEMTDADIVLIRDVISKYEQAYNRKDIPGMLECCDKSSEWFKGLEDEIAQEFKRFKYLRAFSAEKRISIDPNARDGSDVVCLRHAFYVAYLDSQAMGLDRDPRSAVVNEFDSVYFMSKPSDGGSWKIKAWGQSETPEQNEYIKAKELRSIGKIDDAIKCLQRVIDIDPDHSAAYSALSEISFASGKIDDSLGYAIKAASLRPEEAYYQYSLGMIYLALKNKEKAFDALSNARYLDPDFPDIDYYIDNADKIIASPGAIMRSGAINEAVTMAIASGKSIEGDRVVIKDLNLALRKPKSWQFVPASDWHVIQAMSPQANPGPTDPYAIVSIRKLAKDEKAKDVNTKIAEDMAVKLGKKTVIRSTETRKIDLAGLKAAEDVFVFVINNVQVLVLAATLEKNGVAYTLIYSARAKRPDDLRIDTRPYKEMIDGFAFIAPKGDISIDLRKLLDNASKSAQMN
jgi:tetratricopeptide (TPR) repeat protein